MQPQRLSPEQLQDFERDGFLLLPALLSPAQNAHYLEVVARMCEAFRVEKSLAPAATVDIRNAVARADELLELIEHPAALGAMLDILGWNIQLITSQVFARTPNPGA